MYDQLDFNVPLGSQGDNMDRFLVRLEEMRQSVRIVEQCLRNMPGGPYRSEHPLATPPLKERTMHDIETLINHFLGVSWGPVIPAGEAFMGIVRSIYSAVGGRPVRALAMAAVVIGLIVWPALWLVGSLAGFVSPPTAVAVAVGLFALQWGIVVWDRRVPFTAWILYPLVFANLIAILMTSMVLTGFGPGVAWKGRTIRTPDNPGAGRAARLADEAGRSGKAR